jgi:hypothetical protein
LHAYAAKRVLSCTTHEPIKTRKEMGATITKEIDIELEYNDIKAVRQTGGPGKTA